MLLPFIYFYKSGSKYKIVFYVFGIKFLSLSMITRWSPTKDLNKRHIPRTIATMPPLRPLLIILICILASTLQSQVAADQPFWFQPHDATAQDNAYNTTAHYALQWWYCDAMLSGNYSATVGILTLGAHATSGFFLLQINIYTHGELLTHHSKLLPIRSLMFSMNESRVSYHGTDIIHTYLNNDQHLCLAVNLTLNDLGVNLLYTGTTPGWIGDTGLGMWGCPLPKATVNGTITVHGEQIPVQGTGYEEHGWDIRHLHRSWQWGKITTNHFNIIFSKAMHNRWKEDLLYAIINTNDSYVSIQPQHITLRPLRTILSHGRLIPLESLLEIHENPYTITVLLQVQTIHYQHVATTQYWRFFVHATGSITCNNVTEPIDDVQIMEFFHRL